MKLYNAEHVVQCIFDRSSSGIAVRIHQVPLVLPKEKKFTSSNEVQSYVNHILALPQVVANHNPGTIIVRKRKGTHAAHYEPGNAIIAIPENNWALRELVVLHEIAHHLHYERTHACSKVHDKIHGQEFLEIYVDLCKIALGEHASFLLRTVLIDAGLWGK